MWFNWLFWRSFISWIASNFCLWSYDSKFCVNVKISVKICIISVLIIRALLSVFYYCDSIFSLEIFQTFIYIGNPNIRVEPYNFLITDNFHSIFPYVNPTNHYNTNRLDICFKIHISSMWFSYFDVNSFPFDKYKKNCVIEDQYIFLASR